MNDDVSILRLLFIKDGVSKASVTIASKNSRPIGSVIDRDHIPEYIDVENTKNVPFVSDIDSIDGYTPIMIYQNRSDDLSPILLLEETEYEVVLSGKVDSALGYISDNSKSIILRRMNLYRSDDEVMYILNFRGYVGKGYFDVTIDGTRISIPFEVRSKKIDYLKDYPLMLEDISKFSVSLIMSISSPLHERFTLGQVKNDTSYEDFMLLDYIFKNKDLIGSYNIVRNNRHRELKSVSEVIPSCISGNIDPCELGSLVTADNLFKMDGGPIAGEYAPLFVSENYHVDDYDTPENRIVKDLIVTLQNNLHQLIASLPENTNPYISNRLSNMCMEIDRIASDSWLRDVNDIKTIPFNSTVLQSKEGYSNLFEIYQMIGMGVMFKQGDIRDLLEGQNNRMYQIYEYWCYIRLYRCLSSLSENKPQYPLEDIDGKWNLTIRKDRCIRFTIPVDGSCLDVDLYYNRRFNQSVDGFRSYSVNLCPDYTLLITNESKPDSYYIINFDAKYKSKPKDLRDVTDMDAITTTDCWEFDICKMHTYRDALLHSFGSYVLYPGDHGVLYPKPLRDEDWMTRHEHIIPSIGAICLKPGDDEDCELEKVIMSILRTILNYSIGEYLVDPTLKHTIE